MNTNTYSLTFNTLAVDASLAAICKFVLQHPELDGLKFTVSSKKEQITIAADSFHVISLVHRIFLSYKDEQPKHTKNTTKVVDAPMETIHEIAKETAKVSYANLASKIKTSPSSSSNSKPAVNSSTKKSSAKKVDSTGKSSPVVIKKPIHPDIVANRLIARTIGNKGCFMREIQDKMGATNVQRISVGDKVDNYFYTIYASSQQWADDTYVELQKHEFDIIKECIRPSKDDLNSSVDSSVDTDDCDDDLPVANKPEKVYPPGTSWADMMDDDDE